MNNIVLFRERMFAPKFSAVRVQSATTASSSLGRIVLFQRPRLMAVWHTNPHTGKLECFWTTENVAVSDEDDSRRAA
ncbi:hypothetical protein A6U86_15580 [Rhizobium sp. AC27/96]|uniref:hypothetical protein n=1 Tax=Rhizobium TaxID=379 RepID=UPI000827C87B|nr:MULTISPECIES: hypothetical protein [Rhizobium]OCI95586.1 hypothetical protein A6U86_15580 [Rhizobium sp. AC27/96]